MPLISVTVVIFKNWFSHSAFQVIVPDICISGAVQFKVPDHEPRTQESFLSSAGGSIFICCAKHTAETIVANRIEAVLFIGSVYPHIRGDCVPARQPHAQRSSPSRGTWEPTPKRFLPAHWKPPDGLGLPASSAPLQPEPAARTHLRQRSAPASPRNLDPNRG